MPCNRVPKCLKKMEIMFNLSCESGLTVYAVHSPLPTGNHPKVRRHETVEQAKEAWLSSRPVWLLVLREKEQMGWRSNCEGWSDACKVCTNNGPFIMFFRRCFVAVYTPTPTTSFLPPTRDGSPCHIPCFLSFNQLDYGYHISKHFFHHSAFSKQSDVHHYERFTGVPEYKLVTWMINMSLTDWTAYQGNH